MGSLEDALCVQRENIPLFRALVVDGKEEQKENLALALQNCTYTFFKMGRLDDALSVQQEAVSLFFAIRGQGERKEKLLHALRVYKTILVEMGRVNDALGMLFLQVLIISGKDK